MAKGAVRTMYVCTSLPQKKKPGDRIRPPRVLVHLYSFPPGPPLPTSAPSLPSVERPPDAASRRRREVRP